jgi:DNA-directed RNA polymerase specialized sigma subunit
MDADAKADRWDSITPALRALLSADFSANDPAAAQLWSNYLRARDDVGAHALEGFYLPVVFMVASKLKRRRPAEFPDDFGTMISDGYLTLCRMVRRAESMRSDFAFLLYGAIVRGLYNRRDERSFGGRGRIGSRRSLSFVLAEMSSRLGRPPSRQEVVTELRRRFKQPGALLARLDDPAPRMIQFPEPLTPGRPMPWPDDRAPDPADVAERSDLYNYILRNLSPVDGRVLAMILDGRIYADIGKALGFSRQRVEQRLKRIIKQVRALPGLAGLLDTALTGGRLRNGPGAGFERVRRRPRTRVAG